MIFWPISTPLMRTNHSSRPDRHMSAKMQARVKWEDSSRARCGQKRSEKPSQECGIDRLAMTMTEMHRASYEGVTWTSSWHETDFCIVVRRTSFVAVFKVSRLPACLRALDKTRLEPTSSMHPTHNHLDFSCSFLADPKAQSWKVYANKLSLRICYFKD